MFDIDTVFHACWISLLHRTHAQTPTFCWEFTSNSVESRDVPRLSSVKTKFTVTCPKWKCRYSTWATFHVCARYGPYFEHSLFSGILPVFSSLCLRLQGVHTFDFFNVNFILLHDTFARVGIVNHIDQRLYLVTTIWCTFQHAQHLDFVARSS